MIVETPTTGTFGAAATAGIPDGLGPGAARFGVVMKAAYDLVADGTNPRTMVQSGTADRAQIVVADTGELTFDTDPPAFDVQYEADVALAKDRTDIVVTGLTSADPGNDAGAVVVNGTIWFTRTPPIPPPPAEEDPDMTRNLFGFQPRTTAPRDAVTGNTSDFANYHRRGGGFAAAGNAAPLPSGGLVQVYRNTTATGDPDYALTLPDLHHGARLRVYCGHGPDVAPRWRIVPLPDPRPDTLIVHTTAHEAEILWRTDWAADLEPADTWRKVQIRQGGF